jgi:hypothetical protein
MLSGKQIKIIKRAERNNSEAAGSDNGPAGVQSDREKTKRNAVSIVTEWVNELRRKKSEETVNGFERLFGNAG